MSEKKSNFSVTCSLLSQFIKERRINGELGVFDMGSRPQEPTKGSFRASTTMSLLPGANISAETETISATEQSTAKPMDLFPQQTGFGSAPADTTKTETKQFEKGQLTIFYCGKVLVFDNFPAEKAENLMQLAAKGSSPAAASATAASVLPVCSPTVGSKPEQATSGPSDLAMPIARRASLHRFFAKRKDRIVSKAPYQINGNSSSMGESSKA